MSIRLFWQNHGPVYPCKSCILFFFSCGKQHYNHSMSACPSVIFLLGGGGAIISRAGASTRFTSTSTSTSPCNMCESESESEYLIITWVRVRVPFDEYEYKCEYRSIINILYSMYRQQIFIVRSLTRESSDCYKPGTKLQLPIVHVNYLCQYIYLFDYSM